MVSMALAVLAYSSGAVIRRRDGRLWGVVRPYAHAFKNSQPTAGAE